MKDYKFQSEALKFRLNNPTNRIVCWSEKINNVESVCCTYDTTIMMIIPKANWGLDTKWLTSGSKVKNTAKIDKWYKEEDYVEAELTSERRSIPMRLNALSRSNKMGVVCKISNGDGYMSNTTWVDERCVKYFDNPTFKIHKSNPRMNAIVVFEGNELVGLIMPVMVA